MCPDRQVHDRPGSRLGKNVDSIMKSDGDSLYVLDSKDGASPSKNIGCDEPLCGIENGDKIQSILSVPESPRSSLSGAASVRRNDSSPRGMVASSYTMAEFRGVEEDLRNVRQLLEAKDAVLEPGLAHMMADFVRSGGSACFPIPFSFLR